MVLFHDKETDQYLYKLQQHEKNMVRLFTVLSILFFPFIGYFSTPHILSLINDHPILLSILFFSIWNYILRERVYGRAVIIHPLCMENGPALAAGFTFLFWSGIILWMAPLSIFKSIILVFSSIGGAALVLKGFQDGPSYGWDLPN